MLGMVCAVWAGGKPQDYIPDYDGSRKKKPMGPEAIKAAIMGLGTDKKTQQPRKRMNG